MFKGGECDILRIVWFFRFTDFQLRGFTASLLGV